MAAAHKIYKTLAGSSEDDEATTRNELIVQELPQVHYIASRIHERLPKHVELHDLVQAGVVGLIEACRVFDGSKGAQFRTYAAFRIKGAILDALRSLDWGSRSIREKAKQIAKARTKLEGVLGRQATREELAENMGISLAKLNEIETNLAGLHLVGRQASGEDEEEDGYDLIESAVSGWDNPFEAYCKAEATGPLIAAVATLSEREQQILSLYYYDELTMREVAQVVGIAVSRVCQIHATTLRKLNGLLATDPLSIEARAK